MTTQLIEVDREYYGGKDGKAINIHSTRTYVDDNQNFFMLDRITDATPRYFEAYGPYKEGHRGFLPKIKMSSGSFSTIFGEGWTWRKAEKALMTRVISGWG